MALQIRRGTAAQRAAMSAGDPAQGELIYETDTDTVYVGDGSTAGGVAVGGGGAGDVVGPGAAVDENVVVFDSTTGKLVKDGGINKSAITANTAKTTNATHSGDVTGSGALTIANDAVTYAKMQNVSATDRVLGRDTAGAGNVEEIAPAALRTMINVADGATADQTITYTKIVYIEDPADDDSFPVLAVGTACTITRITHITDAGTVDWNLEERAEATPATAGTDVYASDEQSGTTNSVDTSFSNDSLAANTWLHYSASAVASSPTKLWIKITFTED